MRNLILLNKVKSFIKKYVIKATKVDLNGFDYTVKELVGMYENIQTAIKYYGQKINNEILKYKKSDTIFILGSGPSIKDITKREWEHISQKDSIGFNFWFAHNFVPNFYLFQLPGRGNGREAMLNIFANKFSNYKNVPFIIRGSGFAKGEFNFNDKRIGLMKNNPVYYLSEYPIASRCSIEPQLLYKYMDALGYMTHGKISKFIPKWRGSLGLLIMLAYQMGYKKIVLCGMDMHKSDHFWDYEPYYSVKEEYNLPDIESSDIESFTNENISPNTTPRYVYTLRDWMYEKNRVKIFIMNKRTVLYPKIEVYKDYNYE